MNHKLHSGIWEKCITYWKKKLWLDYIEVSNVGFLLPEKPIHLKLGAAMGSEIQQQKPQILQIDSHF